MKTHTIIFILLISLSIRVQSQDSTKVIEFNHQYDGFNVTSTFKLGNGTVYKVIANTTDKWYEENRNKCTIPQNTVAKIIKIRDNREEVFGYVSSNVFKQFIHSK